MATVNDKTHQPEYAPNAMTRKISTGSHNDVYDVDARRQELAGPSGVAGLLKNPRLFFIAMATAQGGLCYGYEQGACESKLFGERAEASSVSVNLRHGVTATQPLSGRSTHLGWQLTAQTDNAWSCLRSRACLRLSVLSPTLRSRDGLSREFSRENAQTSSGTCLAAGLRNFRPACLFNH